MHLHRPISAFYFRLRNDLYCVGWGVKLYSLTIAFYITKNNMRQMLHLAIMVIKITNCQYLKRGANSDKLSITLYTVVACVDPYM